VIVVECALSSFPQIGHFSSTDSPNDFLRSIPSGSLTSYPLDLPVAAFLGEHKLFLKVFHDLGNYLFSHRLWVPFSGLAPLPRGPRLIILRHLQESAQSAENIFQGRRRRPVSALAQCRNRIPYFPACGVSGQAYNLQDFFP
jgi:hypothetical protein